MAEKWKTLKHNGPVFPKPYQFKGACFKLFDKEFVFTSKQEEMAWAWVAKFETPYVKDKTFQKNFFKDFVKTFSNGLANPTLNNYLDYEEIKKSKFPEDWDFTKLRRIYVAQRDEKKQIEKEVKEEEKRKREELKAIHGFAELDGQKVPLGNYVVEPAGLFLGRGNHPLRGSWKRAIIPEDVIINHSLNLNPPSPPEGHSWKRVEENQNSLFTAGWYCPLTGKFKPILFSATSIVSHKSAEKKFAKAIELANNFDKVNSFIEKKLASRDRSTRQIATVCELIAKMSIRVGDEKDEDEADTVGATTLRVEHIQVDGTAIVFDFLGKDSIRYHNRVENLHINAIRNIEEFINGKGKGEQVFDSITSSDVNEFLGVVLLGLTAKQFRTATGSVLLAKELQAQKIDSSLSEKKKLEYYVNANLEVALKLNHQSAVSEAYERSLQNMKDKLKTYKNEFKNVKASLKQELDILKQERDKRISFAEKYTGDRKKDSIRRAKETYKKKEEVLTKKLNKLEERIDDLQSKIDMKEKTRGVALGTSKLNYSDPRIGISWCKDNNVDIKRLYTPSVQARFEWAKDVDPDFYKKYPNV